MPAPQQGGSPRRRKVILGVGGKPLLYYLPLTIAERKGFFKEEGLEVEINDFAGGAQSLQALVGGSVDVVTGAYEHTIRMQAKGQDIRAVIELGRFPGIVLAVRKEKAGEIKSAADLKGTKIGVTAPGSSTTAYGPIRHGQGRPEADRRRPSSASAPARAAVAAMKKGEIDAISHLDPVISKLEADGDIQVLIDTRTEAGTRALFGGSNPAAVRLHEEGFHRAEPGDDAAPRQRLHEVAEMAAERRRPRRSRTTVPAEYHLGDKPLYLQAVKNSLESYSRDGIVPADGMKSVYDMLKPLDPEIAGGQGRSRDDLRRPLREEGIELTTTPWWRLGPSPQPFRQARARQQQHEGPDHGR